MNIAGLGIASRVFPGRRDTGSSGKAHGKGRGDGSSSDGGSVGWDITSAAAHCVHQIRHQIEIARPPRARHETGRHCQVSSYDHPTSGCVIPRSHLPPRPRMIMTDCRQQAVGHINRPKYSEITKAPLILTNLINCVRQSNCTLRASRPIPLSQPFRGRWSAPADPDPCSKA